MASLIASAQPNDPVPIEIKIPGLAEGARPLRLVRIPAGTFKMGSPETERGRYPEGPVHQVTIGYDFYMGETEVTHAQWKAIMQNNPALGSGVVNDYPVAVSWDDITEADGFLDRLNALGQGTFRLPSEAEWEYACRAGTTTRFYFGDSLGCDDDDQDCAAGKLPGNRSDYMWYGFTSHTPTYGSKPVRHKLPNAFGLYDMHGNEDEWCQDYWHHDYIGAPTNGSPWLDIVGSHDGGRVIRSGSWIYRARQCRSAMRMWDHASYRGVGLRVVRLP